MLRVVRNETEAVLLLGELVEWSLGTGYPVALDTETVGCDPKTQSPIENARLWCLTLAWGDHDTAFVPAEHVNVLTPWLEDNYCFKVGSNIFGYDRHVLANHGIRLRGIMGDTERMSRLLDPAKPPSHSDGHGLKALGAALGFETVALDEICRRPRPGTLKEYKQTRVVTKDGVRYVYVEGAAAQNVSFSSFERLDVETVWEQYPQRRQRLVDYAVQDARMSLAVYSWLREKLAGRSW